MDVLFSILNYGFWPRYCFEDVQWQGFKDHDFIAYPMVCFCDIPLGRIAEHVDFYGSFGIGLTKEWGARNNLNPVSYYTGNNQLHQAFQSLITIAVDLPDEEKKSQAVKNLRYLLAYSKPTIGRIIVNGTPVPKEFYQESEWRYIPQHENVPEYLLFNNYGATDVLDHHNALASQHARLTFYPSDVRYLFVPTDADIPPIMNYITSELDRHPSSDLKVLMSRVTSLESVTRDL